MNQSFGGYSNRFEYVNGVDEAAPLPQQPIPVAQNHAPAQPTVQTQLPISSYRAESAQAARKEIEALEQNPESNLYRLRRKFAACRKVISDEVPYEYLSPDQRLKLQRNAQITQLSRTALVQLRKYLHSYGVARWSKVREQSRATDAYFAKAPDSELRPYGNYYIRVLLDTILLSDFQEQKNQQAVITPQEVEEIAGGLVKLIKVPEAGDPDYGLDHQAAEGLALADFGIEPSTDFTLKCKQYLKRFLLFKDICRFVRHFFRAKKAYLADPDGDPYLKKLYEKNANMLSFLPEGALTGQKPGPVWTRRHDQDLILGCYTYGFGNYDKFYYDKNLVFSCEVKSEFKLKRISDRVKLVVNVVKRYSENLSRFDFTQIATASKPGGVMLATARTNPFSSKAFNLTERRDKNLLVGLLLNYGVPTHEYDESRDDFEKLKVLLQKLVVGPYQVPRLNQDQTKNFERYVAHLRMASRRILRDYSQPVQQKLGQNYGPTAADDDFESQIVASINFLTAPTKEPKNDFSIDLEWLEAAKELEEDREERLIFDRDGNSSDFGFEVALALKVRVNMFKIIRTEIISHNFHFFEHEISILKLEMGQPPQLKEAGLPKIWNPAIHDKNLLGAIARYGLPILSLMPGNTEYEFDDINKVTTIDLLRRIENLCFFFKKRMPEYKAYLKKNPLPKKEPISRGGDFTTGRTRLDIIINITQLPIEKDEQGNIIYPIRVNGMLELLDLGRIEWQRPQYHSSKNVFPIGFKSVRDYQSMIYPNQRCKYINEVLDGGVGPLFRVTCMDDPEHPLVRDSSSGVWMEIVKRTIELNPMGRTSTAVSGPDKYGLSEPSVSQLLSTLPGARNCTRYRPPGGWPI